MRFAICGLVIALLARQVEAQQSTGVPTGAETPAAPADAAAAFEGEDTSPWSFSLSAFTYIADGRDYVQPTLTIDHDWLHLEARYNYEDLDTASVWIGYNFTVGDTLTFDFTPMVGGVFGDTSGVAPGYQISLGWHDLRFYTAGEYVFDTHDSSENFFYAWSELTYSITDWLRAGVAAERTKIREESSEIEIGPMIGLTYERVDFTAYVLFPEEGDPTLVLGVGFEF